MSRLIAVGEVRHRPMALIVEQLLRDQGISATSEMGMIINAYAEVVPSRILVPEGELTVENIRIIKQVLGEQSFDDVLDELHMTLTGHRSATVLIASVDAEDAEYFAGVLRDNGIPVEVDGESLLLDSRALTRERAALIVDYLGDMASQDVHGMLR